MKLDLVPEALLPLAPIVEVWGPLSQDAQDARLKLALRHDPAALLATARSVRALSDAIRDWSLQLGFPSKHRAAFTDEDWVHPYWLYLNTLTAMEAVPGAVDPEDPDVRAGIERMRAELREEQVAAVRVEAAACFRAAEHARVVDLLGSIEPELTPAERKKLALAAQRLGVAR
jgi:hypothetical protein